MLSFITIILSLILVLLIILTNEAFVISQSFFRNPKIMRICEKSTKLSINEEIKVSPIRLVIPSNNGSDSMYGIVALEEGLRLARDSGLDLVLINENGNPPVCKILDYPKFRYAMIRKTKENNKKHTNQALKIVKLTYNIDIHDFNVRIRAAKRFLADGHMVRCVVQFKGREMQHTELGQQLLNRVIVALGEGAVLDSPPLLDGRMMSMNISPKKTK